MADKWYTKNVGPLPAGAWLGVVAAGLALYWFRRKKGTPDVVPAVPTTAVDVSTPDGVGNVGGWITSLPGPVDTGPGKPTTNNEWRTFIINHMIGDGYDGLNVSTAVGKYLTGMALNASEASIMNIAITKYGPPPESVGRPTGSVTDPTPSPAPASPSANLTVGTDPVSWLTGVSNWWNNVPSMANQKAGFKYVVLAPGQNLVQVAALHTTTNDWHVIFDNNRDVILDPNLVYPGLTVRIPENIYK